RREMGERKEEEEHPVLFLQNEMSRLMDRFSRAFSGTELSEREEPWKFVPSVDVSETDNEIHVSAELPGMEEKDIDVSLSGNHLIIRGEKKTEKEKKDKQFYRKESSYGSFHRSIPLPTEVEEDKIEATFKKGVLKIDLPKSAEARKGRKKIEIK
ncbi:MAG: Hsp20/alpha crystallin family protein, partial [Desulfuromonadales bacterium]